MIKLIHKYNKSISIVFLFMAAIFALSGVGLDILHGGPSSERHAVTVNERKFSFGELEASERRIEDGYRRMFGDNYAQILKSFSVNSRQQAVDNLVDTELLQQEVTKLGLTVGDEDVRKHLLTRVFGAAGGFNPENYKGMLQGMGVSAKQFEGQIKQDLARNAFAGLLRDAAFVSERDVTSQYIQQETTYTFVTAGYDAKALASEVPTPSDEILQRYFESKATDYELPARVSYDYIALEPSSFESAVNVTPQDVELYYADNSAKYTSPEQLKLRSIKLLYPKESDPTKLAAVREKAKKAHEDALSGKPFESLVTTYSDDLPSKAVGGDRGWVSRGSNGEAFDTAVFKATVGGVADLVETDTGFEIVKVEEKRESRQLPLDEVKADIEKTLRAQEAPAYAAAKAREVSESARRSDKPLAEVAQSFGLSVSSTSGELESGSDPLPSHRGLTQKVMLLPTSERSLASVIDSGDSSIVVQVKEFKEPSLANFTDVKEKVLAAYKSQEASKLAETKAQELLAAAKSSPGDLKKEADARKALFKGPFEISRAKPSPAGFTALTPEISKAIFSTKATLTPPTQSFRSGSEYLVAVVTDLKKPDPNAAASKDALKKYAEQTEQELQRDMLESTLALLKSRSAIEIDPSVLVTQ